MIKRAQTRDRLQEVKALLRLEARYVQKLADFADSLIRIMNLIYTITGKTKSKDLKNYSGVYNIQKTNYFTNHFLFWNRDEVDDDMTCQICLQPFVEPLDTPCGHTFCRACLLSYLKVNPMCPLDRKPLNEMVVQPSNLVLKRYVKKMAPFRIRKEQFNLSISKLTQVYIVFVFG